MVKQVMTRLSVSLLRVSELHWKENGHFKSDDFQCIIQVIMSLEGIEWPS